MLSKHHKPEINFNIYLFWRKLSKEVQFANSTSTFWLVKTVV